MGDIRIRPVLLVIFGITGDLAKRKLLPALYHLIRADLLPEGSQIIGVTRQDLSKSDVLAPLDRYASSRSEASAKAVRRFTRNFHLFKMDMAKSEDYAGLRAALNQHEAKSSVPLQRLYYLSIPPSVFDEVVTFMGRNGLQDSCGKAKLLPSLLVEKPFGYDHASAERLITSTKRYFKESQIYRIDHYLAKEMAQNILSFRYLNPLFEATWDSRHISSVAITAYESIGIENRAAFYEQTGALRDLIQSHLLQLLTLVATERPSSLQDSGAIHARRLDVLRAIVIPRPDEVAEVAIRGQYEGYQEEVGKPDSTIETYAAVKLFIDTSRWHGVPFILRTGKALRHKTTRIDIRFGSGETDNVLSLLLQPDEGMYLDAQVKTPGHAHQIKRMQMDFSYARTFPDITSPEAYERVLLDAFRQDQSLFASSEEVLAAWRIVDPILHEWSKPGDGPIRYKPGSLGPTDTLDQS